jgi:hypothetical protein
MTDNGNGNGCSARDQLVSTLQRWHAAAGRPSMRAIAAGSDISHTTVHGILTGQHVPAWPRLAPVVQYLDGDMAVARQLWELAMEETSASDHLGEQRDGRDLHAGQGSRSDQPVPASVLAPERPVGTEEA